MPAPPERLTARACPLFHTAHSGLSHPLDAHHCGRHRRRYGPVKMKMKPRPSVSRTRVLHRTETMAQSIAGCPQGGQQAGRPHWGSVRSTGLRTSGQTHRFRSAHGGDRFQLCHSLGPSWTPRRSSAPRLLLWGDLESLVFVGGQAGCVSTVTRPGSTPGRLHFPRVHTPHPLPGGHGPSLKSLGRHYWRDWASPPLVL